MLTYQRLPLATVLTVALMSTSGFCREWSVPLAGNKFPDKPDERRLDIGPDGSLRFRDAADRCSVYFSVNRPGIVRLAVKGRAENGSVEIQAVVGDEKLAVQLRDSSSQAYSLGDINVARPGYVRVALQCKKQSQLQTAAISDLIVASDSDDMTLDFVRNNEGNMYYWGRRGPSVHLGYQLPANTKLTYAYSEITVPRSQDVIGAYFMANGFSEGYFGIQVNSNTERRVLFSVWSPFETDNPADIPADERVVTLAKGNKVSAQDFGNEGSGGQSYLVYPWKSGVTYRFLTHVEPDGLGNTRYTSWFGEQRSNQWLLIASFRRPKTDKYLTGFHSFLENFSPDYGHLQRSANYGNQWVCDVDGKWHEITQARFTGDGTARGRHRLDFAGGSEGDHFFLKNCGFFAEQVSLDQIFQRPSVAQQPDINFEQLPRK